MNRKYCIYFLLFLAASLISRNSYSENTVVATKEMPLEINLLLESLQINSPDSFKVLMPIIYEIDRHSRLMSKEDIFFLGKVEIYKKLLKNYEEPIKQPIDGSSLSSLRSSITKVNDKFTKWFLQALLKDSLDLMSNPLYKEFLLQKNNGIKSDKIEYRKLEKRGELIQHWVSKLNPDSEEFPDSFQKELAPKMLEALRGVQYSFALIAKETSFSPEAPAIKDEKELKFFAIQDKPKTAPPAADRPAKSVEDILAPVIETPSAQDLPRPSQENWLEDENAPPSLQNLPKPTNDADWLRDF